MSSFSEGYNLNRVSLKEMLQMVANYYAKGDQSIAITISIIGVGTGGLGEL